MQTLKRIFCFTVVMALFPGLASAGWPTTIIGNLYDAMVKEPLEVKRWADALKTANEQLTEMRQVYSQAQTIAAFIGDGKVSVQDLAHISKIAGSLGNIAGEGTSFEATMREFEKNAVDFEHLFREGNEFAAQVQLTMDVGNQRRPRNVSLYQALAAAEQLANTTREYIHEAGEREDDAQKRIDKEVEDLLKKPSPTQTDIQTLMVKLQREALAQQSEIHRLQVLLAEQEQEQAKLAAQSGIIATQAMEPVVASHQSLAEDVKAKAAADKAQVRSKIFTQEPEPSINSSSIRVWLPDQAPAEGGTTS
jgi:hypothetical protein